MVYRHPSLPSARKESRCFRRSYCDFRFRSICRLGRFRSVAELANAARCIDRGHSAARRDARVQPEVWADGKGKWSGGVPV